METAGPGDLQQLLCHLRGLQTLTPPPPPAPVPMDVQQGAAAEPSRAVNGEAGGDGKTSCHSSRGGQRWACPQCSTVRGFKNGCDAHIRQVNTGKALV